jgi:hypothetical protein
MTALDLLFIAAGSPILLMGLALMLAFLVGSRS